MAKEIDEIVFTPSLGKEEKKILNCPSKLFYIFTNTSKIQDKSGQATVTPRTPETEVE